MKRSYPETRKGEDSTVLFGHEIPDPFRWLEDDTSAEVARWVEEQNAVTSACLSRIPFRGALKCRLETLLDYRRYGIPFTEGGWRYFFMHEGLQNQAILFREKPGLPPEVFLDPNSFSTDGTTSLAGMGFSRDGSLLAYQISEKGSDWRKIRVVSTDSPDAILETISDAKFSQPSWHGNEGFFYSSYPRPADGSLLSGVTELHRLMFHRLGTPQSEDELVFGGDATPRRYINGSVTEDGRWLVINAAMSTTGNEIHAKDLSRSGSEIITVVQGFENEHGVVHSSGDFLFLETSLNAPNNRLVRVDTNDPGAGRWVDVIPEREEVLSTSSGGGYFFASYLKDALSTVEQLNMEGESIRWIELPGAGTAGGFDAKACEDEIFYSFTNYLSPTEIFVLDPATGETRLHRSAGIDFDPSAFESYQVFYTSRDGTRIPMMLTHRRGLSRDGSNPLLLSGYGGFNHSLTPAFGPTTVIWVENGGVFAVPNLRGGGEYGEKWHLAGTRMQKQNVFDDFVWAAEYLIDEGYTDPERLVISGGSNGGLLVGAAMTQRPGLFRVALPDVGVMDMLRYHRFTAGAGWAFDYGTAEDDEEMLLYLLGYSPLHNLKSGVRYPATLVTTADHDDRVVPAHSFKFAARLQEVQEGDDPVLIRIDVDSGHGMGKPLSAVISDLADRLSFAFSVIGTTPIYEDDPALRNRPKNG